jgi:hypothetical protein
MREMGLSARQGRRRTPRTTDNCHDLPIIPNRLERNFTAERLDQVWLADISYILTDEGWLYLAAIKDMATRQISVHRRIGHGLAALPAGKKPNPSQRSRWARRIQVVVATRCLLVNPNNRSSASAGVFQASVLRGHAR